MSWIEVATKCVTERGIESESAGDQERTARQQEREKSRHLYTSYLHEPLEIYRESNS